MTAYGLAVEHYQQNEVIWSGNNGTVIFFQNELPYDPPSQTAWETSPVQPGYPSFLVTNNVQNFNGYGMASYVVFIYTNATLWDCCGLRGAHRALACSSPMPWTCSSPAPAPVNAGLPDPEPVRRRRLGYRRRWWPCHLCQCDHSRGRRLVRERGRNSALT